MVSWILLILFFVLLIGFLLIPINICVDTSQEQYYIQLRGLVKASIEGHREEILQIHFRTLFTNFYFYPLRKRTSPKLKKTKEVTTEKSKRKIPFRRIIQLLKSFKVKKLAMDIDTGNCILNAKLYPAFTFLNYRFGNFNINFEGKNQMVLFLQNRPIHILKSFIKN